MPQEGGSEFDIQREADGVAQEAELNHVRRDDLRSVLKIPEGQEVSDEELDRRFDKELEMNYPGPEGLRVKWGIPKDMDPVKALMLRIRKRLGL